MLSLSFLAMHMQHAHALCTDTYPESHPCGGPVVLTSSYTCGGHMVQYPLLENDMLVMPMLFSLGCNSYSPCNLMCVCISCSQRFSRGR